MEATTIMVLSKNERDATNDFQSSNLGVKVYLCFVNRDICRLIDLEKLWGM